MELRQLGMRIKEIEDIIKTHNVEHTMQALKSKREEFERQMTFASNRTGMLLGNLNTSEYGNPGSGRTHYA